MGNTISNPIFAGQVPSNPVGTQIAVPGSASNSGQNTLMPAMGTSSSAPSSANPYTAGFPTSPGGGGGVAVPGAFGANGPGPVSLTGAPAMPATNVGQAATSAIGGMSTMSSHDIGEMFNSLRSSYGEGPAHAILNFLTGGAGFNQDAINNLFAGMQPQIERGTESLMNQFSQTGNRFGSGAQIGLADYLSQVNLNEGQIETQMYEQSVNDYMNVLMGTSGQAAQTKANSPSMWDTVSSALPLIGSGANALNETGASGTGGLSQLLTLIGSVGGG
jgi:hypothetical protein